MLKGKFLGAKAGVSMRVRLYDQKLRQKQKSDTLSLIKRNSSKMDREKIHPHAFVEEGARIGKNVTIEPFAVVKKGVVLEDNVTIRSHAYIDGFTTIGEGTTIWPSAVVGTQTQDLKYRGEKTFLPSCVELLIVAHSRI